VIRPSVRLVWMVALIASCAQSNEDGTTRAAVALETSPAAHARVKALRERFLMSGVKARPREKGKDVIWVPTADIMVEKMLELANVTAKDRVVDLGSGDGRLVIGAAKRGAHARGIEYDPQLIALSKSVAEKEGVTARTQFEKADLFETDFSDATVVTLFLLPEMNLKLQPKLFDLRPGTRIVANTFPIGEWKADDAVTAKDDCTPFCTASLFIVPAKVAGTWKQGGVQLELEQEFQFVSGTWSEDGVETPLVGRLRGDALSFAVGATRYDVHVRGDTMEGHKRFRMTREHAASPRSPSKPRRTPVISSGTASFVESGTDSVRALVPREGQRARTASVEVPRSAAGFVRLEDDASRLSVSLSLRDAKDVPVAVADGMALYAGALGGADLLHRPHAQGIEHFVILEKRPEKEEISYLVDVSHVTGLRLVAGTLELLDESGAPRLRLAPPYLVDAAGTRHPTQLAVEGCKYDQSPAAPWGRPVTKPGDSSCSLRVSWQLVVHPAIVDLKWTTTFPMVEARRMHTASVLPSGRVLIAGGAGAELFDPTTGTFAATGSMSEARSEHTASVLASGRVLIVGGNNGGTTPPYRLASAELYDPATGKFSSAGSMSSPRSHHTASVLGSDRVLIAGGTNDVDSLATAELYDAGKFSMVGSMTAARTHHTATVLASGKVLVAGGVGPLAAELYDPVARAFSATGSLAQPRANHTASLLPTGKVLIVGGSTAELYDPVAGEFSAAGSLAKPRARHTASVLASGQVLVAGGVLELQPIDSAELYDPAARRFSKTDAMASARDAHTATVLVSGEVLMTGGDGATAELYAAPAVPRRRSSH